jgi:(1->4)-alpha-D-glucan 1-alpha-D-glucosylmutase
MLKAVREAKTYTSWTNQNKEYESGLVSFVRSLLIPQGGESTAFLSDVQNLVARIARPGFWNSLSRTLIHFTAPGTPDLYQGDELWNFALVDPDNRRPVDYAHRQQLLDEVIMGIEAPEESRRRFIRGLIDSAEDGRIKLHVVRCSLAARREFPHLFACGKYLPLQASGPAEDLLFAFARIGDSIDEPTGESVTDVRSLNAQSAIVVVPRLTLGANPAPSAAPIGEEVWSSTTICLPDELRNREWTCAITRERVHADSDGSLAVSEVLRSFPAALLVTNN